MLCASDCSLETRRDAAPMDQANILYGALWKLWMCKTKMKNLLCLCGLFEKMSSVKSNTAFDLKTFHWALAIPEYFIGVMFELFFARSTADWLYFWKQNEFNIDLFIFVGINRKSEWNLLKFRFVLVLVFLLLCKIFPSSATKSIGENTYSYIAMNYLEDYQIDLLNDTIIGWNIVMYLCALPIICQCSHIAFE